jgi:plasmid stabilization system protein ParE
MVEAIGDYIAKDAPERAIEFTDRLLESTSRLTKFPLSGSLCPEDTSCRQIIVNGYRVVYEITASGVEVLTVLGPGQNPDQIR